MAHEGTHFQPILGQRPFRGGRAPRRENIDHFLVDNFIFGGINGMCSISEDGGGPSFSVFRKSTVLHKLIRRPRGVVPRFHEHQGGVGMRGIMKRTFWKGLLIVMALGMALAPACWAAGKQGEKTRGRERSKPALEVEPSLPLSLQVRLVNLQKNP